METFLIYLVLLTCCSIANARPELMNLKCPYPRQKPPGMTPEIFAPGFISTDKHEFSCCFSPDGKYLISLSRREGESHPFRMSSKIIEKLKPDQKY